MRNLFLHPLLAPLCVLLYVGGIFMWNASSSIDNIMLFCETTLETTTFFAYVISILLVLFYAKDFLHTKLQTPYFLYLFLFFCAALREMGIQHWLTDTDTTAFKLRFFTNPNNPLSTKILSAFILLTVGAAVIYLLYRFTTTIIRGFFKFNPMFWTICTLGATGIIGKIADRIPGNYRKDYSAEMDPYFKALFSLLEESSEVTLPLLFALAIIQFHLLQKRFIFKNNKK